MERYVQVDLTWKNIINPDLQDLEYYAKEYMRHGLHGPLNWYRTRRINFEDDLK
jgi:hypothetical protein